MNKEKIIKILSLIFFFVIIFLLILKLYFFYKDDVEAFNHMENAIISMYEENDKETIKYFEKAYLKNDKDVYLVINSLANEDVLDKFYENKDGLSFGYSEFKKGTYLIYSNKSSEGIKELEKSVKQNNRDATYFLALHLYSLKRYTEAFKYIEKAYKDKYYLVYPLYKDMKSNLNDYKYMEELYIKYNKNKINDVERMKLGKFLLEKDDVVSSYNILKPFLEYNNPDALYSKALFLDLEGEKEAALKIYKDLYLKYKDPKSAIKIAENSDISTKEKRDKILLILNEVEGFNKDVEFIKANILYENDRWIEAKKIYEDLLKYDYIPVYDKLAKYNENIGDTLTALKLYKESFEKGVLESALKHYNIIQDLKITNSIYSEIKEMSLLEEASKLGDANASYELSVSSKDIYDKKKYAIISLAQGKVEAVELLVDIANLEKDKNKIKVYTNILINNKM